LLIEQGLGRRLPFEVFGLEMGPAELISSLEQSGSGTDVAGRPRVFVCPGYHGDDLRFMSLRMELEDAIAFAPLRYPDWSEMAAGDPCEVLLNSVVTQITGAAPEGTLMLLGYSFGGGVALMAAHRLRAQGREVRWLGVIDTNLVPCTAARAQVIGTRLRELREEIARVRGFAGLGGVVGFLVLGHCLRDLIGLRAAGEFAHLRYLLPRRIRIVLDRWLGMTMRGRMIPSWAATLLPLLADVPTVLFRSHAHEPEEPEDLGWEARCPDLSIIPVTGDHGTVLDPPNRQPILEGLRNALCVPTCHVAD
jgi:thioesterase domain-containing protein